MSAIRICVIGAGPCGLSALYQFSKARQVSDPSVPFPEIVCYEKQSTYGGMWNYTWRTGLDEYGEPLPNSYYNGLWTNAPKEVGEFSDYTYEEHFGKILPSFMPFAVGLDYVRGRFLRDKSIFDQIRYKMAVHKVNYRSEMDDFEVQVKDLANDQMLPVEYFSHVIVCTGHYSVPHCPEFPGIKEFTGSLLHVHNFRNMEEFTGKTILVVGASYSAEDMVLMGIKYGVKKIILVHREQLSPAVLKWPQDRVERRAGIAEFMGDKCVRFHDKSIAEVDAVILCTGYFHHHPYMAENLRTKTASYYPPGLYKGVLWLGDSSQIEPVANNKLFYMAMQDLVYSFPLFDMQAWWIRDVILGRIKLPDRDEMRSNSQLWVERVNTIGGVEDLVNLGTDYLVELGKLVGCKANLNAAHIFMEWAQYKGTDVMTYRDKCFKSLYTGNMSIPNNPSFFNTTDNTVEGFLQRH